MDKLVANIIDNIYQTDFADHNADLSIDMVGYLNYTKGVKLRFTFVDSFNDDDVKKWKEISRQFGATGTKVKVNTSDGSIDLNIEYKRVSYNSKIWIVRALAILVATWSYQQLHQLQPLRYPIPELLSQ